MKIRQTVILIIFLLAANLHATENLLLTAPYVKIGNTQVAVGQNSVDVHIAGKGGASFLIPIEVGTERIQLNFRMKTEKVECGSRSWENARLAMRFLNAEKKPAGAWPDVFGASGTTDWRDCSRLYDVPEDAAFLKLEPWNFGLSGVAEFKSITLTEPQADQPDHSDAPPPVASPEELWSLHDAAHRKNQYREEFCLNGLWQFKPIVKPEDAAAIPAQGSGWRWFKVPGSWPGEYGDGKAGRSQQVYGSSLQAEFDPTELNRAWYRRTILVPADWKERRISLDITMLQTCAQIFIDGSPAGELYYPGGELDLTGKLQPGTEAELAILVTAQPDSAAQDVFMAPERLVKTNGKLQHRGITGDVFLSATPEPGGLSDVLVKTSVARNRIECDAGMRSLSPGIYELSAEIVENGETVRRFSSEQFTISQTSGQVRKTLGAEWTNPKLWDIDSPENLYTLHLRLLKNGSPVDELYPEEFGFREFTIQGRNFMLNGSVIHLRSLIVEGNKEGASRTCAESVREIAKRARQWGFNHLTGYDYSFAPGRIGYLGDYFRETSRQGILTSLTLPHGSQFNWKLDDPAVAAQYRRLAEFLIRRYQNLPGVVMYAMNHNAAGHYGDQNPLLLGRPVQEQYLPETLRQFRKQAVKAQSIAAGLDPTRIIYHHAGSIGGIHAVNCYLNWAPPQERSDWLETWEKSGTMPVMMSEWGLPHIASWSSMRGPGFIWSSPAVQCAWMDEYNAEHLGESAYALDPQKIELARHQEQVLKTGKPVYFESLLKGFGNRNRKEVVALFAHENFRAFRIRGLSFLLPWDQDILWTPAPGQTLSNSKPWPERFINLKRPGIVPDLYSSHWNILKDPFRKFDASVVGERALPYLRPAAAWIAGKSGDLTEQGHNFRPGGTVEKTLFAVNDLRRPVTLRCRWEVPALNIGEEENLTVEPGGQAISPVIFVIPPDTPYSELALRASFEFPDGSRMQDDFTINVLPQKVSPLQSRIGLYDPEGSAEPLLETLGISAESIRTAKELDRIDLLVVGRNGLRDLPWDLEKRFADGLKILFLEQSPEDLERMGFRWNSQGLRRVFPAAAGFHELHHWRGAATLTAPYIQQAEGQYNAPRLFRNDYTGNRVWRAGNRGNIASILIEKPAVGDFKPLLQGGFDLQYTPLLEFRSGKGMALFSQLDLSGRTEPEPEAFDQLSAMLERLDRFRPVERRPVRYQGNPEGRELLAALGFRVRDTETPRCGGILVVTSGADVKAARAAAEAGADVLALALNQEELGVLLPEFPGETGKFFSDFAQDLRSEPLFDGISNSDLHWRIELPMTAFTPEGRGGRAMRTAKVGGGSVTALQVVPWMLDDKAFQLRSSRRRNHALVARLLHNLNAENVSAAPFLQGGRHAIVRQTLTGWKGLPDPEKRGRDSGFWKSEFRTDDTWRPVRTGQYFEQQFRDLADYDGWFWYRLEFDLNSDIDPGTACRLDLGRIDDESWVWLNGNFLGEITAANRPNDYWAFKRSYPVAPGVLRKSGNTLVVLCNDLRGNGGMPDTPGLVQSGNWKLYAEAAAEEDDPYRYYRW